MLNLKDIDVLPIGSRILVEINNSVSYKCIKLTQWFWQMYWNSSENPTDKTIYLNDDSVIKSINLIE